VVLPDSTILIDYLLAKTTWLISGLVVNSARMRQNLDNTNGLIFSGQLLLDLAAAGMLREDAYRLVQGHAMEAWQNDGDFHQLIQQDKQVASYLSEGQLAYAFSLERQLKNVDAIFRRVFQSSL
jgi:adenylosuccinate lyase